MSGLRPVPEGARLEDLSASDFTRNNRATAWVEAQRESLGGKGAQNIRGDGIARVKNNSGDALPRYSVLGIDGPLFDPLIYFDAFNQEVALIGSVPEAGVHSRKFAILQEPLVDLEVGRAWSDGISPCKIDSATVNLPGTGTGTGNPQGATHADIIDGVTDRLAGGTTGFPIIWMSDYDDYEAGTGTGTGSVSGEPFRWALIRMSSAGDSSATVARFTLAETDYVLGPYTGGGVYSAGLFYKILSNGLVDTSQTFSIDCTTMNGLVFPSTTGTGTGSGTPSVEVQHVVTAMLEGVAWRAIAGGVDSFDGTADGSDWVTSDWSDAPVYAPPFCANETAPDGTRVGVDLKGDHCVTSNICCPPGVGT